MMAANGGMTIATTDITIAAVIENSRTTVQDSVISPTHVPIKAK